MKKFLLSIVAIFTLIASAKADVVINQDFFNTYGLGVYSWFLKHFNKKSGDTVTDAELATVKILNTNEMSHASGGSWIGLFPELERLTVSSWVPPRISGITDYNWITTLNLSNNKKLKYIRWVTSDPNGEYPECCTPLEYFNIDGLTELDTVIISFNKLDTLDFSHCPKLKYLSVTGGSALACLKLDGCESLETLDCSNNQLKILDLAQLPKLTSLDCSNNLITALDLTGKQQLTSLNIANNLIQKLTVDGCNEIPSLDCSGNLLTELSVKNCEGLSSLKCNNNRLQTLSIDNLPKIETLNCSSNRLTNLSIANCEKLTTLNCGSNRLKTISIENTPSLQSITCNSNYFQDLDFLNDLTSVTEVNCTFNPFISLDLSKAESITKINFSKCTKFTTFPILPSNISAIICSHSPIIAQADLSPYTKLTQLQADSCELTDFNAAMCPNLEKLSIVGNHIMELDLSALYKLSSKSGDVNIEQEIEMPAVWRAVREKWEITMPASFDVTRMDDVVGNYIGGTGMKGNFGTQVWAHGTTFTDAEGNLRVSIFTDEIKKKPDYRSQLVFPFFYLYETNCHSPLYHTYCRVNVTGYQVPSGVDDVNTTKTVSTVRYYDLQGHESATPFPGFNIEVTHFTDGTTQSQKIIK
ncbi:MAG: leucine-rich repeat domain-containing protein [bacterium]|nr:leucine-rich repeat domain-containing protein [bacterium]